MGDRLSAQGAHHDLTYSPCPAHAPQVYPCFTALPPIRHLQQLSSCMRELDSLCYEPRAVKARGGRHKALDMHLK
jgi:hypothetical protein